MPQIRLRVQYLHFLTNTLISWKLLILLAGFNTTYWWFCSCFYFFGHCVYVGQHWWRFVCGGQVFRQTCVPGRDATSFTTGGSRLEVIEMEYRRRSSTPQMPVSAKVHRPAALQPALIDSSKSQLIVHCDATNADSHNNVLRTSATASRDIMVFDVV